MDAIGLGDIYEDCAYHAVLCTHVHDDGSISGISLIDASSSRTCDLQHCGVIPLTIPQVLEARRDFAAYVARRTLEDRSEGAR